MADTRTKLSGLTVGLHWLIALAIIANLTYGFVIDDMPRGDAKVWNINLHKSVGMSILLFALVRLGWRTSQGLLQPVAAMPIWEALLHRLTVLTLLLGSAVMPLTGIYYSISAGRAVEVFGLTVIPQILDKASVTKEGADAAFAIHSWLAFILCGFIALHVLGALKHHVLDGDGTLKRMLGAKVPVD
jgi:cytochrome b561